MIDFVKNVLAYFVSVFVVLGILFVLADVEKRLLHAEDLAQATLKVGALALVLWILGIAFVIVIIALVIKK
jgi:sterol desaturase/sphingolipid hydroxylase (fatty acid hydroxylase superfamily)